MVFPLRVRPERKLLLILFLFSFNVPSAYLHLSQRESFYADLVEQNTSGRLGNQDCPQRPPSPGDMLRLTEFIRDEPRAGVDMHVFEGQEKELLVR